ncbi:hypothetical protein GPJ56_006011 [Histomonas meleagridis]|uniref:uncharacterized protein n=1 Tax=Histomonas meleagridis TaxID=135588 RepID=UPI003559E19A|nr:hypothetical protein GPJ56_006011 [Histomonas meleagridis]KAH0799418.1 hypothetical protein GO595_007819 [Histomonas meleagridis]
MFFGQNIGGTIFNSQQSPVRSPENEKTHSEDKRYESFIQNAMPPIKRALGVSDDECLKIIEELYKSVPSWMKKDLTQTPKEDEPPFYPDALLDPDEIQQMDPILLSMFFSNQ